MEINYYRDANAQGYDESWQACQFTSQTDLTPFRSSDLVTINGQPYLRQHHVTYLTGKETCRAHHFAKHLAIQVLSNEAPSTSTCKVLWIDTLNSPYVSAPICRELASHTTRKSDLHYLCLDILGDQRDNHWWLTRSIESLIKQLKPQLVVIDDIDHFMPYCGVRIATEFKRVIRDAVNHTHAAFLCIGYNHTGKKACTAGELGKHLFYSSNDIFSLSTVREVTTVRHISGYDLRVLPGDSQFHFTIGPDNLPRETDKPGAKPASGIDDDTLRDIIDTILQEEAQEGQASQERQGIASAITPSSLIAQVKSRHAQLKRDARNAALLDQIRRLTKGHPRGPHQRHEPCPHRQARPQQQGMASAPSEAVVYAAALRRPPQPQEINTSLTLPPHPQPIASCPVDGSSAAVTPNS